MSDSKDSGQGTIPSVPFPESSISVSISNLMSGKLPDIIANRLKEYPSIFRVPESIRKWDSSAYAPQHVAIGPYHSKRLLDNDICKSLEQYKVWSVHSLLSDGSSHAETQTLIQDCLTELESLAPRIRRCYSADDIGFPDDDELAKLMLLDGCFILILFLWKLPNKEERPSCEGDLQGPLLGYENVWMGVLDDLLKIENQIPLFVLTTLLRKTPTYGTGDVDVIKLARELFKYVGPDERESFEPAKQNDEGEYPYDHLLHFYYSSRLPEDNTPPQRTGENKASYWSVAVDRISECLKALTSSASDEDVNAKYLKIPKATELDREGVGLKKRKNPKSFVDIKFTKRGIWGKRDLEIPRLVIWDDTHHLLRNLVAFEQCSKKIRVQYVSYYVISMDCLIDDSKDVGLLESGGILVNTMDVRERVAVLSSNLAKGVSFNEKVNYLGDLYGEVNDYCKSFWHLHRHVAKMTNDYFKSPWSCLSLLAAIVLLVMTCMQTVYAIIDHYNKK